MDLEVMVATMAVVLVIVVEEVTVVVDKWKPRWWIWWR